MTDPGGAYADSGSGDGGTLAGTSQDGAYAGDSSGSDTGSQANDSGSGGYTGKINPAWEPVLKVIPEQMHGLVTPHLRRWDDNYRALQAQYTPWKQGFVDRGYNADQMQNAATIFRMVNDNPQEFYRRLGEALGVSPQQAEQMVENENEGEDSYYEEDQQQGIPPQLQQQLDQLTQQNQQLMENFQQQQYNQQVNQYEQQLGSQVEQIRAANPNLDVQDLMNRYLVQIDTAMNNPNAPQPDVMRAYQEQQSFIQNQIAAMGLRVPAPNVMSPGGGYPPSGPSNPQLRTQDERIKAVTDLINLRQRTGT